MANALSSGPSKPTWITWAGLLRTVKAIEHWLSESVDINDPTSNQDVVIVFRYNPLSRSYQISGDTALGKVIVEMLHPKDVADRLMSQPHDGV